METIETGVKKKGGLKRHNGNVLPDHELAMNSEDVDGMQMAAPDGGWGWFVVFGSFFTHVIIGGFERANGVFYLELRERFGKSATDTAWVPALCTTLTYCAGPLASAMCNRFSLRFVATVGSILAVIGTLISGFGPNLAFLYFSYGIMAGFGRAMIYVTCLVIVGFYFDKRRGMAVGLATSGTGVGTFVFPPMLEQLFSEYGFRGAWIILAAIASNFLISAALFRPLQPNRNFTKRINRKIESTSCNGNVKDSLQEENTSDVASGAVLPDRESNEYTQQQPQNEHQRRTIIQRTFHKIYKTVKAPEGVNNKPKQALFQLSLFKDYAFTTMCLETLLFSISFLLTIVFLPALAQSKGLTKIQGAYLLSILGVFDAVSRIVVAIILDLKQIKKFRLIIYNIIMVLIGVLTLLMTCSTKFWQFAVISAFYGMTAGTHVSQKSVVLVDMLGVDKLSSSFGLLLLFQGLGCLIGPVLGGLLRDYVGSYEMSFYTGSIGVFIGAVILASGNIWIYLEQRSKS